MKDWTAPAGLSINPPRSVQPLKYQKVTISLILAAYLGLPSFMSAIFLLQSHKISVLKQHGAATIATIIKKYETHSKGENYHIRYEFLPPNNGLSPRPVLGEDSVLYDDYSRLDIGATVPILYDPAVPGKNILNIRDEFHKTNPYYALSIIIPMIYVGFIVVGAQAAKTMVLRPRAELRIFQYGIAVPAVITREKMVRGRYAKTATIFYEFRDRDGRMVRGKREGLPMADNKADWAVKDRKQILGNPTAVFDPTDSSVNVLYPPEHVILI